MTDRLFSTFRLVYVSFFFFFVLCCFFVFQAEDGIRDLVRSRGLGDVYKRQDANGRDGQQRDGDRAGVLEGEGRRYVARRDRVNAVAAVSYTHLTLPTSDLV